MKKNAYNRISAARNEDKRYLYNVYIEKQYLQRI